MTETPTGPLRRATPADGAFLDRSLRRYSREIAAFSATVDAARGLEPAWLSDARLHPFVVLDGPHPVGFALVLGPEYARTQGETVDRLVYDFWVEPAVRGAGLARRAAVELFAPGSGAWAVPVLPANVRALAFWRAVLAARRVCWSLSAGHEGLATYRFRT